MTNSPLHLHPQIVLRPPCIDGDAVDEMNPQKIRRCNSTTRSRIFQSITLLRTSRHIQIPATSPATAIAVTYRPSLFMLLIATLLPRNAVSLRWLALSGGTFGGELLRAMPYRFDRFRDQQQTGTHREGATGRSMSWLTMALDPECLPCNDAIDELLTELWSEVTSTPQNSSAEKSHPERVDDEDNWQTEAHQFIFDGIPRGGAVNDEPTSSHAGLINLGNTCYLNAQLQAAYHVPYLRQLVLDADDEVVDIEVEVEEEVDEEEECREGDEGDDVPEVSVSDNADGTTNDEDGAIDARINDSEMEIDTIPDDAQEETNDASYEPPQKRTRIRREIRHKTIPISSALRALQHTFSTLSRQSSGTTNVLCRALGINPYLQQDGQEFWKLFVPEVDYDGLAELYSGHFDDYIREKIVNDEHFEEEKKEEDVSAVKPRERVRKEPFLDLSIPVAEGGGSVETTLADMFTEPEILRVSEGNGWRPSKDSSDKVDAFKGSSLKREGLPSLLQLHLKRFIRLGERRDQQDQRLLFLSNGA